MRSQLHRRSEFISLMTNILQRAPQISASKISKEDEGLSNLTKIIQRKRRYPDPLLFRNSMPIQINEKQLKKNPYRFDIKTNASVRNC